MSYVKAGWTFALRVLLGARCSRSGVPWVRDGDCIPHATIVTSVRLDTKQHPSYVGLGFRVRIRVIRSVALLLDEEDAMTGLPFIGQACRVGLSCNEFGSRCGVMTVPK